MAKFEVGDRVQAINEEVGFVRAGDMGTVTAVDVDGDVWALWDDPAHPHLDAEGWCVDPANCLLVSRPGAVAYATDPAGNGYILRNGERMSADEIVAALNAIAGASP